MNRYHVIGLMSGTSLDGLDIAECVFEYDNGRWSYNILNAETTNYSDKWKYRLAMAGSLSALDFISLHKEYGVFLAEATSVFIKKYNSRVDFISSHGHTIFHQPEKKITCQIGDGAVMAALLGKTVINDFRSVDVALSGQGAPLVPVGDKLLFADYDFCLNLGGIANISYIDNANLVAFDICPFNMALNMLAEKLGLSFDKNGDCAKIGKIDYKLLHSLDTLDFYFIKPPKSLGKEWFLNVFNPLIEKSEISVYDKLRTVSEHFSCKITDLISKQGKKKILITGGGAHNAFFVSLLQKATTHEIVVPDTLIVDFKEALIFAFLGVLCLRKEINCFKSVTGAKRDNVGGCIYNV